MFKKITQFIKYNTLTTIIIAVAFVAVASAVASDEGTIDKIIGEEIVETQGVDNTLLLATDLEEFDLEMKIMDVFQDDENYYVDYQFNTLGIQDDVWREIFNQSQLVVSIESLEGGDLGLYVMEELGEVIDYQLAYLKEVQENEEEKGETFVIETTEYTGLIGLVLDTKTKELPGYELVVKPPVAEEIISDDDDAPHPNPLPRGEGDDVPVPSDEGGGDDYVEDSYYYEFLINNCLDNGGYWYNNTCNAEADDDAPHPNPLPLGEGDDEEDSDDTLVCDLDNLDLCTTQELCEGIGLYWYDDVCNGEEEDSDGTSALQPSGTMEPTAEGDDEDAEEAELPTGSSASGETSAFTCDADHPTLCDAEEICKEMGLYWYEGECHVEEG